MTKKNQLSILIPVYNEQDTILQILKKVNKSCNKISQKNIIVINDGSTDGTSRVLANNKNLYTLLININQNKGKGFAIIEGLKNVSDGYILIQDADLEYDPLEIPRLWEILNSKKMDLLLTSRLSGSTLTKIVSKETCHNA